MLFNSYSFIIFFAIVLALHYAPFAWRSKKRNLLIASYVFYAAWSPPFVLLLVFSTVADWILASRIYLATDPVKRRWYLFASLAANLGMLSYFKYGGFLLENFSALLTNMGITYQPALPNIILPVGISFYTFQTLSYTLDVYFKRLKPGSSFLDYAMYVTFFPQLVAGPIVRARDFLPQCVVERRANSQQLGWGLFLMTAGLFQKVVVADALLAPVADKVFDNTLNPGFVDAWIGTMAFAGQIYSDFAGYSTCAIGAALCFGFTLPDNFRYPYAALGFSDFWHRWHISLSTWLRDYLYIPLGGNRKGKVRTRINLMLTMLLGGLWHGASWNFVIWGGLHGLYLVVERFIRGRITTPGRILTALPSRIFFVLLTFVAGCFAWVFFRAGSLEQAIVMCKAMTGISGGTDSVREVRDVMGVMALMLVWHWYMRDSNLAERVKRLSASFLASVAALMLLAILHYAGDYRAFIYFQF